MRYNVEANLYGLQTAGPLEWLVTKFDMLGLEILSQYRMFQDGPGGALRCECPASHRSTCRHREMFHALKAYVDTNVLYRYGDGTWHDVGAYKPQVDALEEAIEAEPAPVITVPEDKPWRRPL